MAEQKALGANENDLLWRHLKTVPAFRALLRAVEARFYRQIAIPGPTLDLGCGDGHFAGMAFDRSLTAGADPWWGPLQKARTAGVYRLNVQALGHRLPFPDNHFSSVISNSVLEHIPDVQPVLQEAGRVLRPDGKLVVTMPSHLFTAYLGGAQLLRPLGLADAYRRFFNTISRHAHTDPPEAWGERLAAAGFRITRWQYYFSRGALRTLEVGHVQGLPSAILHFLTGHWVLAPWPENLRATERWVRPYYEETPPEEGAYLFIVAQKVADSPIAPFLPPPDPLPVAINPAPAEPQPAPAEPGSAPAPEAAVPPPARPTPPPPPAAATEAPEPQTSAAAPAARPGADIMRVLLLGLGLLLAFLGQNALEGAGDSLAPGLTLYGLALLAFAGAVFYARQERREAAATSAGGLPRRRLLYPLALLLAVWAQSQANATLFEGHPLSAFLLWFLAIAVGYYALMDRPAPGEDAPAEAAFETPQEQSLHENRPFVALFRRPGLIAGLLFLAALLLRLVALGEHPSMLNGIEASLGLEALAVLRGEIRNPFAASWLSNPTLPLYPLALPVAVLGRSVLALRLTSALVGALTVPALYLIGRRLWGETIALASALLLAGYHLHVHYSRLGMTNAWDPLLGLLALGAIGLAFQRRTRHDWLLAGLATGLTAYFFTPSRLMPFLLGALLLYLLLFKPAFFKEQGRHALAGLGLALVVALPQLVFFNANPGLYMERANVLGILHGDWLPRQMAAGGRSALALLGRQLADAFLAFNATLDTSSTYNPGIPLLRSAPALLFVVGAAVSVARLRQLRHALLLIWIGVTLLFAGALLVDAPDSHRLLIAAPAAVVLVAVGLTWLGRQLLDALHPRLPTQAGRRAVSARLLPAVLLLAALFVAGDLLFYFGEYRAAARFGDRNTEVAYEMARYLQSLQGEWTAYFHGPPNMYVSFPTIPFLAGERFEAGRNLYDVGQEQQEPAQTQPPAAGSNLVFIFLPERSHELNQIVERYPQGAVRTFDGTFASPLFYAYEVRR